jgi:hypothetical protein
MKIKDLAVRMGCAIALANWASPSLPDADPSQQGSFDGDHQDRGAAAIAERETADSGKETAEVAESTTENLPEARSAPCQSIQRGHVAYPSFQP